ncbi:hypothetical protein [Actinoplanes sp. M2I2]|uniref:hypothetical protein n=1 Tax=Actinoplanes sp. M2I2 TaxID=1734444 RepID=UPI002020F4C4|nr:hypothetical protein [Actinoplanes sp. M2I2]
MNDEEYGILVLRPLGGDPEGPSAIDVGKAMRDGRRRRRRWWTGGSTLAAVLVAALTGGVLVATQQTPRPGPDLPPDPVLPAACTAGPLPTGPHESAEVSGGDPSGAWLVGMSDAHLPTPPVSHSVLLWHNGELVADVRPRDVRKGSPGVRMNDVNGSGVAVGSDPRGNSDPWVLENGEVRKLAGAPGEANAINDAGVIAGRSGPPGQRRPVRWTSPDAEPTPLPVPAGLGNVQPTVTDIAPDGTIIGEIGGRAYLWWPDGTSGYVGLPTVEGRKADGFLPMAFSHGWLYGTLFLPMAEPSPAGFLGGEARDTPIYRYDLRSRIWQKLADWQMETQVAGTFHGQFMAAEPKVFVGRQVLSLPAYPAPIMDGTANFLIENVSDDARTVAGTALSGVADPSKPAVPVIWRCR